MHNFSIEESCSCKDRFKIKDNLVEEDLPQYLSGCSTEEREVFQKELISVLYNVALTQKEEESLIALGEGKSISRLALEKGVSRTAIRMKKKSGIAKVQENESILAQKFYDIASLYKDKYGVKENEEKIIKTFIKKAYYAKDNIEDISKNGIYFYGGATRIVGLERFMSEHTKFKIHFSNISKSNIVGTGELIKYPQLLKRILKNN